MLTKVLAFLGGIFALVLLVWVIVFFKADPYINETLQLDGSREKGEVLFRMNCVGCHGISAQGLLGPELYGLNKELTDRQIINQVVRGKTPPMPSFEIDPQKMADLLTYLKSLK